MTENVGFRLREIGGVPLDVESYPMGGAVNAKDKLETHQVKDTSKVLTIDSTVSYITIMKYSASVLICCVACSVSAQTREHAQAGFTLRLSAVRAGPGIRVGSALESNYSFSAGPEPEGRRGFYHAATRSGCSVGRDHL